MLLEASRYAPSHGSWFHAGNAKDGKEEETGLFVCSDRGLLLLTEVDPLLVALPALDSARALSPAERQQLRVAEAEAAAKGGGDGKSRESSLSLGRFVDAEAALCGGEKVSKDDGVSAERRAAAALPLLVALAASASSSSGATAAVAADAVAKTKTIDDDKNEAEDEEDEENNLSPPSPLASPRSAARSDLLRAAGRAIASVCDAKEAGGDSYFRLCESRAASWLRLKARRAAAALKDRGGPAFAALEGEALEAAGGALLAEWLPREWSERMGWPSPGSPGSSAFAAPAAATAAATTLAQSKWDAPRSLSLPPSSTTTEGGGPFTRDPNLAAPPSDFTRSEERYEAAGEFAKRQKMDAAAAAREKARVARADEKALAAKKEASTMKSLAGFFVVKKKN